ncbi:MAG: formyltetrahydrofolate deformylase [Gammaproteobacteria bacterium]|nr:formyltetrahydrofolate deformylase [Gammaproteobacteria bacterium]
MSTNNTTPHSAMLLISCPDQVGIVAAITDFLYQHNGNIIDLEQHVGVREKHFFMRIEWNLQGFSLSVGELKKQFGSLIAERFNMDWQLSLADEIPRMALFVSKHSHCLYDILARYQAGEWNVRIPVIISNHPDLESAAKNLGIDFHVFPMTKQNKKAQEHAQLTLLQDYGVDFIVLARYMQILTGQFIAHYPNKIINIHHSFLPAFPGAKPYHSAYERGVKVIGATSHYVTAQLDAGPIIAQDVIHVRHTDAVDDLVRKGRDIEKLVLARAIWHHLRHKIVVCKNRTVVFS